ncbi:PDCD10 and GCKIII kinases-associated protein 1 [Macrotis lagotis]|uniref:PDCD10 and GCKIII kinases-associated protein 1 n=1 Tax=Macrotis lagotis TaxID=92651 RepID=UPI003D69D2BA
MGCRCCKMIQSYLFDPVHAPPAGYINEVNSYKLEEEDGIKLKGKENSEMLVHKNDLQSEEQQRTETKNKLNSTQEPFWHHRGPSIQEDHGGNFVTKTNSTLNGIGSSTAVSPSGNPSPSQEDFTPHDSGSASLASAASDGDPVEHFVKETDPGKKDHLHQATEETQVILSGDSQTSGENASSPESNHVLEVQNRIIQLPIPDYPQVEVQVINQLVDKNDCFLSNHIQVEPMDRVDNVNGDHISDLSFSKRRTWNSLNEAIETEALTINFHEDVSEQNIDWNPEQEDAAVAEALAALEAATAGEDGDEGY